MAQIKYLETEVQEVLRAHTNAEQYEKYTSNSELMNDLQQGRRSPLLEFTSPRLNEIVEEILNKSQRMISTDLSSLTHGKGPEEVQRYAKVLTALERGEDPALYTAQIRLVTRKLSDGKEVIKANMDFPRKELQIPQTLTLAKTVITLTEQQQAELTTEGRIKDLLTFTDGEGKERAFFVEVDKQMNMLRFADQQKVTIPEKAYNVVIPEQKRAAIRDGKEEEIEIRARGKKVRVKVRFSPVNYGLVFQQTSQVQVNGIVRSQEAKQLLEQTNNAKRGAAKEDSVEQQPEQSVPERTSALKEKATKSARKTSSRKPAAKKTTSRTRKQVGS